MMKSGWPIENKLGEQKPSSGLTWKWAGDNFVIQKKTYLQSSRIDHERRDFIFFFSVEKICFLVKAIALILMVIEHQSGFW
jgi:hypothetical protein